MIRYTSSFRLLGIPLLDIRIGDRSVRSSAAAWIAVGDVAFGVLFAAGGFAAATVAVGGVAVAALPFGGLALGVFAVGGLAIGVWSVGGAAVAVHTAAGGLAVAGRFAFGGAAFGPHAYGPVARPFIGSDVLRVARSALAGNYWLLVVGFVVLAFVMLLRSRNHGA